MTRDMILIGQVTSLGFHTWLRKRLGHWLELSGYEPVRYEYKAHMITNC